MGFFLEFASSEELLLLLLEIEMELALEADRTRERCAGECEREREGEGRFCFTRFRSRPREREGDDASAIQASQSSFRSLHNSIFDRSSSVSGSLSTRTEQGFIVASASDTFTVAVTGALERSTAAAGRALLEDFFESTELADLLRRLEDFGTVVADFTLVA